MFLVSIVGTETPFYTHAGARTSDKLSGTKTRPVAIAIAFLLFLFSFFCESSPIESAIARANCVDKPSWGATTWIWTSEVFSMNVRATATGIASQTQKYVRWRPPVTTAC
jgi:hypothetical protein